MPIVGNAWAQSGVAKLFNRIEDNGYKLLYLSARAIGTFLRTRITYYLSRLCVYVCTSRKGAEAKKLLDMEKLLMLNKFMI